MSEEGCTDFKRDKHTNVCEHYCGDIYSKKEIETCYNNCFLKLMSEKSEIDVERCNERS